MSTMTLTNAPRTVVQVPKVQNLIRSDGAATMSLATLMHGNSQRAARSSFMKRELRVLRARLARSAGPAIKETGKFVLTMAVLAAIMAALAALDIMIWLPRVH